MKYYQYMKAKELHEELMARKSDLERIINEDDNGAFIWGEMIESDGAIHIGVLAGRIPLSNHSIDIVYKTIRSDLESQIEKLKQEFSEL